MVKQVVTTGEIEFEETTITVTGSVIDTSLQATDEQLLSIYEGEETLTKGLRAIYLAGIRDGKGT